MEVTTIKVNIKTLVTLIAIPLIVGSIASLFTQNSMEQFQTLIKPPLSPPGIVFPIVWTILYILMGIASYLILTSSKSSVNTSSAIRLYFIQLIVNFFWSIIFFNFNLYFFSFIWLILLWILILITIIKFYKISKPAAYLMIPYFLWVTFAGYLNLFIAIQN
ncbi:MAG: TspO/MBR family protein [Clostridium sp.]|uniref:TspO/MBR family protein n=1 Tax=Clostridium sp. TaxID=1506 RepID=UPI002FC74AE2